MEQNIKQRERGIGFIRINHGLGDQTVANKKDTRTNAQKASDALLNYFGASEFVNKRQVLSYQVSPDPCREVAFNHNGIGKRFSQLDNSETGEEKGNGSLTATTWNNLMSKLGIAGHRIKKNISLEEVKSFVQNMCGAN